MRLRAPALCALLLGAACGDVLDVPTDGVTLSAPDLVVMTGGEAVLTISATAVGANAPAAVEVGLVGPPTGVSAQPVSVPVGGSAELIVTAAADAMQGIELLVIQGIVGDDRAGVVVRLLVRGRPGTLDPTFGGGSGRAGGADQAGSLAGLAVDAQGRIASCATDGTGLKIRRFLSSGAPDTSFSTQGLYARTSAECIDLIGRGDGLVALMSSGAPQLLSLDTTGQAGPARDLPVRPNAFAQAVQLATAPNGDLLVVGTITQASMATQAGVWRFDPNLNLVTSFSDGISGVPGFASLASTPYTDAFGADAVVRANGEILLLVYAPGGQVLSTYELAATGAALPGQVFPEFGFSSSTQTSSRLASLPDERMVLVGGTTDTGFGVTLGNSHFTTAQGVELVGAGARPATAHDLVRHPRNGMVVAGTSGGTLAWRRLDNNETPDAAFAGALPTAQPGNPAGTARIVALPGGGFAISGATAGGHTIVRIWD